MYTYRYIQLYIRLTVLLDKLTFKYICNRSIVLFKKNSRRKYEPNNKMIL